MMATIAVVKVAVGVMISLAANIAVVVIEYESQKQQ